MYILQSMVVTRPEWDPAMIFLADKLDKKIRYWELSHTSGAFKFFYGMAKVVVWVKKLY